MDITIVTLVVLLLLMNVSATVYIGRAVACETSQKKYQLLLVWLLSFFGAIFLSYFLWKDRITIKAKKANANDTSIIKEDTLRQSMGSEINTTRYAQEEIKDWYVGRIY